MYQPGIEQRPIRPFSFDPFWHYTQHLGHHLVGHVVSFALLPCFRSRRQSTTYCRSRCIDAICNKPPGKKKMKKNCPPVGGSNSVPFDTPAVVQCLLCARQEYMHEDAGRSQQLTWSALCIRLHFSFL
jgi:hypothetical protein